MPTATHLPVNTGQWEGAASVTVGQRAAKSRELGAGSRDSIGCQLTAIRCQRALSLPAPIVILSASEGSWYMPIMTHLSVNTGQREGAASGTVGQRDSGTAGQRDAKSRELTASIFFRLSSIF